MFEPWLPSDPVLLAIIEENEEKIRKDIIRYGKRIGDPVEYPEATDADRSLANWFRTHFRRPF